MLKTIKGDLIAMAKEGKFDFIGHGCNCFMTMGAGIALQIAKELPLAYKADIRFYKETRRRFIYDTIVPNWNQAMLGQFSIAYYKKVTILNIYTQYHPGPDFRLNALRDALLKINTLYAGHSIGLPMIGAGIGRGNWSQIIQVIEVCLEDMDVTIVEYDPKYRTSRTKNTDGNIKIG